MDRTNSDVNVPRFSSGGFFTVESVNGVTTVSLHHFPILSSTVEADSIERPGVNSNCVPVAPVPRFFPISGQRELGSHSREGCSSDHENELNSNSERELMTRDVYLPQQHTNRISQASTKTEDQVLQPECKKRSSDTLQLESTKKLRNDISKPESLGWCSLCKVDCITEVVLKDHISGKKHKQMLKKLKKSDTIGNTEKNDKQVKKVGTCKKKCKRSLQISRLKDDSNKCAFADGKNSIAVLRAKKAKNKNVQRAKDDSNLDNTHEEFDMKENAELKEQHKMKGESVPPKKCNMSTKLHKFSKKECMICDVSVCSQADFESHIAGRKHAKMLKISEFSESLLKRKECADAYDKESLKSGNGTVLNDNVKKTGQVILELKDDRGLKADKNDINEFPNSNTDLKDSGPSDYGPLIKDHMEKTAERNKFFEFEHDVGSGAHNEKYDLKEFVEPEQGDGNNIANYK